MVPFPLFINNGTYGYKTTSGTFVAFRGDSTDTYTYATNSTGGTVDMGARNNYRYVNAQNVYTKGKSDGVTTHTGTYTFASDSTGTTVDLGTTHTYRYVNAVNVYNKGKADGDGNILTPIISGTWKACAPMYKYQNYKSRLTIDFQASKIIGLDTSRVIVFSSGNSSPTWYSHDSSTNFGNSLVEDQNGWRSINTCYTKFIIDTTNYGVTITFTSTSIEFSGYAQMSMIIFIWQ